MMKKMMNAALVMLAVYLIAATCIVWWMNWQERSYQDLVEQFVTYQGGYGDGEVSVDFIEFTEAPNYLGDVGIVYDVYIDGKLSRSVTTSYKYMLNYVESRR